LLKIACPSDNAIADKGDVGLGELHEDREAALLEAVAESAIDHRSIDSPLLERLNQHRLIAGRDNLYGVAPRIEPQVFEPEHRSHPDRSANDLDAETFAAKILGTLHGGPDDQVERNTAGEGADDFQIQSPCRSSQGGSPT